MARYVDMIPWEACPHLMPPVLPAEALEEFEKTLAPHQRDARRKGVPSIGSGAVYPVPDDQILCEPFKIPKHWFRAYGLDVGWRWTAAAFMALDPEEDVIYVVGEYYESERPAPLHVHGIKSHFPYPLMGAVDPGSEQRSQVDGRSLMKEYRGLGLELKKANNSVEAGIHVCRTRMETGRLKVFNTCVNWMKEKRLYRRKGDTSKGGSEASRGKIMKDKDHLMDAMRYGIMTPGIFRQAPTADEMSMRLRHGEF